MCAGANQPQKVIAINQAPAPLHMTVAIAVPRPLQTMVRFAAAEGAGAHCEVGASRLALARMFDWLDETLA